ncbi:MAG: helix-turn-helix domain-containing protein [Nitrospirae bacterium]|nr:helix-turn-helix domain-containing protein [Nitrospirota bacterium]
MSWNGAKIRERAGEMSKTLTELSHAIGVSRQTVDAWIKGQIPRGQHLIRLCKELGATPGYFFTAERETLISVPQHRTIRKRPVTDEMRDATLEMAGQYLNLFRSAPASSIVRVIRASRRDSENAKKIGAQLRTLSGIANDWPMDFDHALAMLNELDVYVVFRPFPEDIQKKIYAFYSKICDQRVIFVNTDTNIIDLIFQLLHETVHAVRDEEPEMFNEQEEEDFCDVVATYIQFPEGYVETVAQAIKGCPHGVAVNKLKDFAKKYKHSIFGISKRLEQSGVSLNIKLAGADVNLKKTVHSVNEVLFTDGDARSYIEKLHILSPKFTSLVAAQAPEASLRKLGEWLGLDSSIDAQSVLSELRRIGEGK